MSKKRPTVDTSSIWCRDWFVIEGQDRAQSIAVSHAVLLAFAITLTGAIVAAGSGPLIDAQAEMVSDVAEDRFDEWDETANDVARSGDRQIQPMTVPTGTYAAGDTTEIEIDGVEGGPVTIETHHFVYSPRGSDQTVRYDAGLITRQSSSESRPTVRSEPSSTQFESGTEIFTLNLIQYELTAPVVFQTAYSRDYDYNITPVSSERTDVTNSGSGEVEITVSGPNYESWERYFEDNERDDGVGVFEEIDSDPDEQEVTAKIGESYNAEFRLRSEYVQLNRSNL